jgi:hypothetical protein
MTGSVSQATLATDDGNCTGKVLTDLFWYLNGYKEKKKKRKSSGL